MLSAMTFFLAAIVAVLTQTLTQTVANVLGGWLLDPAGFRDSWRNFRRGGSPELT